MSNPALLTRAQVLQRAKAALQAAEAGNADLALSELTPAVHPSQPFGVHGLGTAAFEYLRRAAGRLVDPAWGGDRAGAEEEALRTRVRPNLAAAVRTLRRVVADIEASPFADTANAAIFGRAAELVGRSQLVELVRVLTGTKEKIAEGLVSGQLRGPEEAAALTLAKGIIAAAEA